MYVLRIIYAYIIFLQPNAEDLEFNDDSLFPRHIGIKEATLLLVKEKFGRYSLLRVSYLHAFKYQILTQFYSVLK